MANRFMIVALLALALVFGTRWCIMLFYSATYAPADPNGTVGQIQISNPVKQAVQDEKTTGGALTPPFESFQSPAGRR